MLEFEYEWGNLKPLEYTCYLGVMAFQHQGMLSFFPPVIGMRHRGSPVTLLLFDY